MKTLLNTTIFTLLLSFIAASSIFATDTETNNTATVWKIDRSHSAINFTINHFFTPVDGTFSDYEADVHFDPQNLEGSQVNVTIPVSSVDTRNERRDGHLQSDDFFNVEQWPNIRFTSHSIESRGDNEFVAIGEMTIRDVTRDFELPFTLKGVLDHPMQDDTVVAGITASAELMRTDYGVGVGDWAATAVVGDKVDIQLNLELTTDK